MNKLTLVLILPLVLLVGCNTKCINGTKYKVHSSIGSNNSVVPMYDKAGKPVPCGDH